MTYIDRSMVPQAVRHSEFLMRHEDIIRQALSVYAEHMSKAEAEARVAFAAGQADPQVKAKQDKSMMTNNGYGQAANMFKANTEDANRASVALLEALYPEDEDGGS
ncbi:hypothetical protein [Streptomyces sp. NPDC055036]